MHCPHFDAGRCVSCTLMGTPYAGQLADKDAAARSVLAGVVAAEVWDAPFASAESGFRNKAKLVAGGRRGGVVLGILGADGVTDLTDCGLYEPALAAALPQLGRLIDEAGLTPYDVASRTGELKHVIVTAAPSGRLLVRLVLRSPGQLPRAREFAAAARVSLPVEVVSVNLQPEHKAVLEGAEEIVLTTADTLAVELGDLTLHLRPDSFFQTNTAVARGLYAQAREWAPSGTVWDLYCGVGGFGLSLVAGTRRPLLGVEIAPGAIASANRTADELWPDAAARERVRFVVGDATSYAAWAAAVNPSPEVVVVNPPRRGIGADLAGVLDGLPARRLLYSSCNPRSLAADLALLPSWRPEHARLFDMFPQTTHSEVLVALVRDEG